MHEVCIPHRIPRSWEHYYYFNRSWNYPEGGSSNTAPRSGVHRGPPVRVDRGSDTKLPDWLIREVEETLENNMRDP